MNKIKQKLMVIAALFFLFQLFIQPVLADNDIDLEFFYNENCGSCIELIPTIDEIENKYNDSVTVEKNITKSMKIIL